MLRMTVVFLSMLLSGVAHGGEFITDDPVRAFVHGK